MEKFGSRKNVVTLYPEVLAGGFSRCDGTVNFYQRINALISPSMTVLDYGAGRGVQLSNSNSPYRAELCRLQGKVKKIVGVDVDDAVMDNPFLDESHVIAIDEPLPFPDNSFDLIYADWVLEHVATPELFTSEISRLLKPGGWFCARTPNRWGITGFATNLIPNRLHSKILAILQPSRQEIDVFPTCYKLNSLRVVRRYFSKTGWKHCSYITNAEPPYVQRSILAMRAIQLIWRLAPPQFNTVLNIFVQKK